MAGDHRVSFNAAILCSLSPFLSDLIKEKCCEIQDDIYISLPHLKNWNTLNLFKTFLFHGVAENISKSDAEDLQVLIQMMGLRTPTKVYLCLTESKEGVEDENGEKDYIVEIKYEVKDDEEVSTYDLFTEIQVQVERIQYREIKGFTTSTDPTTHGNIEEAMFQIKVDRGAHDAYITEESDIHIDLDELAESTPSDFEVGSNNLDKETVFQEDAKVDAMDELATQEKSARAKAIPPQL